MRNIKYSTRYSYLLWSNIECDHPHIHLSVVVHTRQYEEDTRTSCSTRQEPAQSEDDGSLVLLNHLHCEEETEWKGDHDEQEGEERDQTGADPRPVQQKVCSDQISS